MDIVKVPFKDNYKSVVLLTQVEKPNGYKSSQSSSIRFINEEIKITKNDDKIEKSK
jgi:hypothetical protein